MHQSLLHADICRLEHRLEGWQIRQAVEHDCEPITNEQATSHRLMHSTALVAVLNNTALQHNAVVRTHSRRTSRASSRAKPSHPAATNLHSNGARSGQHSQGLEPQPSCDTAQPGALYRDTAPGHAVKS